MFIKLTDSQRQALLRASFSEPIYDTHHSERFPRVPDGAERIHRLTARRLVRAGYLKPAGNGGYLLTEAGAAKRDKLEKEAGL
jgi:hypothetical protein